MNKFFLIVPVFLAFAASSFAQGAFVFQAYSGNGLIYYSTDGVTSALYPTTGVTDWGNAHISVYAAPDGTVLGLGANGLPDFTGWTAVSHSLSITTGAGKTAAYDFIIPNAANNINVEAEIVGWTGTATSWAQALASGSGGFAFSGQVFNGIQYGALGWSQPTADSTAVLTPPTAYLVTGAGGYNGLVFAPMPMVVPEPSALSLLGVGAAFTLILQTLFTGKRA